MQINIFYASKWIVGIVIKAMYLYLFQVKSASCWSPAGWQHSPMSFLPDYILEVLLAEFLLSRIFNSFLKKKIVCLIKALLFLRRMGYETMDIV